MTESTQSNQTVHELLERNLAALMRKDKRQILACFSADAVFIDPHYPFPEMRGRAKIGEGMDWVFAGMERLRFVTIGSFTSDDGASGAVELQCDHILKGGRELSFRQVLIADTRDGMLTRVQAYEPYGPGGIAGFVMGMQNSGYRSRRKRAAAKTASQVSS